MITYNINRFIHSVIRENKLVYLMELLLSEWKKEDILFVDFIRQLKSFLQKENEQIFDDTKLKYIAFLEDFKNNVENIKDLKNKDNIETNSLLFRLYNIPKKRNNLLLVFLLYFYINNKNKLWWDEIFKIIVYRNRMSKESREQLIEIDNRKFRAFGEIIKEKIKFISRRHSFLKSAKFKFSASVLWISLLSAIWYFNISWNSLRADVLATANNNSAFWKMAFDSVMIWRVSDTMISSVQWFWLQNILLAMALVLLVQSLKTSISTVFFNSLLTKIFQFLWAVIKYIYRAVFFLYDYITYKLETKYIFSFLNFIVDKKLAPGPVIITLFSILYSFVYFFVVYLYIFFFVWAFNISANLLYIIPAWIIVSVLVMYLNFHNDINNFKSFLMEIELMIKEIYDKSEKDKKEEMKVKTA